MQYCSKITINYIIKIKRPLFRYHLMILFSVYDRENYFKFVGLNIFICAIVIAARSHLMVPGQLKFVHPEDGLKYRQIFILFGDPSVDFDMRDKYGVFIPQKFVKNIIGVKLIFGHNKVNYNGEIEIKYIGRTYKAIDPVMDLIYIIKMNKYLGLPTGLNDYVYYKSINTPYTYSSYNQWIKNAVKNFSDEFNDLSCFGTHTARRSFVCNLDGCEGYEDSLIAALGGWTLPMAMDRYHNPGKQLMLPIANDLFYGKRKHNYRNVDFYDKYKHVWNKPN